MSYITTQLAFSFTVAPFILLNLPDSLRVWSRVYFYCVIGAAVSMAFFASPGKKFLIKQLEKRNNGLAVNNGRSDFADKRTASQASLSASIDGDGVLGLPNDPGKVFDEAMQEVIEEVQARRRRGSKVDISQVKREKGI